MIKCSARDWVIYTGRWPKVHSRQPFDLMKMLYFNSRGWGCREISIINRKLDWGGRSAPSGGRGTTYRSQLSFPPFFFFLVAAESFGHNLSCYQCVRYDNQECAPTELVPCSPNFDRCVTHIERGGINNFFLFNSKKCHIENQKKWPINKIRKF